MFATSLQLVSSAKKGCSQSVVEKVLGCCWDNHRQKIVWSMHCFHNRTTEACRHSKVMQFYRVLQSLSLKPTTNCDLKFFLSLPFLIFYWLAFKKGRVRPLYHKRRGKVVPSSNMQLSYERPSLATYCEKDAFLYHFFLLFFPAELGSGHSQGPIRWRGHLHLPNKFASAPILAHRTTHNR